VENETLTNDELPLLVDTTTTGNNAQKNAFINTWVNNTILYKAAESEGILSTEDFQKRHKEFQQQMAIHLYLQKVIYKPEDTLIDEQTIQNYFTAHRKEFVASDNKVHLNGAFFRERSDANRFRAEIVRGKSWKQAVEATKKKNTAEFQTVENIFYTRQTIPSPELWNVALTLRSADVSFPVPTPGGFAIIKVFSLQEKGVPSRIEFVRDEIRQRLIIETRRSRYETLMQDLRTKYHVEIR
jgi:parvulin-like peptidyl-prolyl isomerase